MYILVKNSNCGDGYYIHGTTENMTAVDTWRAAGHGTMFLYAENTPHLVPIEAEFSDDPNEDK